MSTTSPNPSSTPLPNQHGPYHTPSRAPATTEPIRSPGGLVPREMPQTERPRNPAETGR